MTDDFYKKAFDTAIEELSLLTKEYEALVQQEEVLEDRMDKLRGGAISLASLANIDLQKIKEDYPDLFQGEVEQRIGITDAVRETLRSSEKMMTVGEIRDRVYQLSPAVAGHKSPMASIHAVLRRLMDSNQIIAGQTRDDRTTYGWIDCSDAIDRINRWTSNPEDVLKRLKLTEEKK